MTIQSSEGATQTEDGSIDRPGAWVTLEAFKNIRCHIQEKSQFTVTERFARTDEEHNDLIYHQSLALYNYNPSSSKNQTQLRIIVNKSNPTKQLTFPITDENDIEIYDFRGQIEQVKGVRTRTKFFIIRCQRNNRWES